MSTKMTKTMKITYTAVFAAIATRRADILKAYRNRYPTDAFVIYPDSRGYIAINAYDWLEDESLYIYVSQEEELAAFTKFFLERFAKK